MRTLSLVTNPSAPFFQQQVEALEARGVECDVLAPTGTHTPTDDRSVADYVRLAVSTVRDTPDEYDLIHANYGLTAPAALAQVRLPVVLSLWGSDLHGRFGLASRIFARVCDEVIVMTQGMADRIDRPCHIIPHGVDLDHFRPRDGDQARDAVGWSTTGRKVLFPYDPDRSVKNYALAEDVVTAVRDSVEEPVDLVTVSGVPHERMVEYLNAADVLLLTSHSEGSPNVVKEALACNVPVVARDVGDVAVRLAGVTNAATCRSRDELVASLRAVLQSGGRSDGRSSVAELGWERTAARIEHVYRRAVGRPDEEETASDGPDLGKTEQGVATGRDD